jgi:transcription initiation factor TFIID subunit 1
VSEAFRDQSEGVIRSELKEIADFQRGGFDSGWWVKKPNWDPPTDIELQLQFSPENACAMESMMAAKQYLLDMGIEQLKLSPRLSVLTRKLPSHFPDLPIARYIEEELQLTPWNLSSNFLWAQQGQGFIKLSGLGNPLGKGQGFSYVKAANRSEFDGPATRSSQTASALTGTESDLRSVSNDELKAILLSFGVDSKLIDQTQRWERVDLVRQKATEAVMAGIETQYTRFARYTRNTFRAQRIQFKKDAQAIFTRQCEVLARTIAPLQDAEVDVDSDEDLWDDLAENLDESPKTHLTKNCERSTKKINNPENDKDEETFYRQLVTGQLTSKSESIPESLKKSVKKVIRKRQVLKKTVTFFKDDGSNSSEITWIRDPVEIERELHKKKLEENEAHLASLAQSSRKALKNSKWKGSRPSSTPVSPRRSRPASPTRSKLSPRLDILPIPVGAHAALSPLDVVNHTLRPSPTITDVLTPNEADSGKKKKDKKGNIKCSACGQIGHARSNKNCPVKLAAAAAAASPSESVPPSPSAPLLVEPPTYIPSTSKIVLKLSSTSAVESPPVPESTTPKLPRIDVI